MNIRTRNGGVEEERREFDCGGEEEGVGSCRFGLRDESNVNSTYTGLNKFRISLLLVCVRQ
jgi:hypothetical protein